VIRFLLFPGVGDMLKKEDFNIDFETGSLLDAFAALIKTRPELEDELLDNTGDLKITYGVFVNDQRISADQRGGFQINENDVITLLPNLAGG